MARYLTINSQFNPISFEEMIKPAILYKEEYERQQDALDELSKNSVLSQLSNSSVDSNAYKAYQSYMNGVNDAADKLMDTGKLDSNAIRKLRRNYNEVIAPYENKFKNRAARIEEQRKNYSLSKMYSRDFSNISLDDFTDDMSYSTIDLNDIFKDSATKLLNNYQARNIRTPEEEINSVLENYDMSDFDDNQKSMAINAAIEGRNAAIAAMNEYERKSQIEEIKANAAEYRARASLLRARKSGNSSGKVETSKVSRILRDGTTVILTKKGDKYYDDKGVEVTDPDDIDALDKKSKKYNKTKYAKVGTTVYIRKRADGQAVTTDNMGTDEARDRNRKKYIDQFNDAEGGDIINNSDELIDYIDNNVTDETLINALKSILGVDSDGNIDTGWFVNGKRIIIKKMTGDNVNKYYYGIKIENRPSKKDNSNKKSNQEKSTKQEADNQAEQTENVESEQNLTEDEDSTEDDEEEKPIGVD